MKTMKLENSEWNWVESPVRFDPSREYLLCEQCWNGWHHSNCLLGRCGCGCTHGLLPRKPRTRKAKPTGEGLQRYVKVVPDQLQICMDNPILVE